MKDNFSKLTWEEIEVIRFIKPNESNSSIIKRAKVHGGWLIDKTVYNHVNYNDLEFSHTCSLTFIPDINHDWKI